MSKTAWKIDPETKDLSFTDEGMLEVLEDDAAIAQGIALTLGAWKGDFELVPSHGTDYEQILGTVVDEETTDEVLREAIFQEEQITTVESLGVTQGEGRKMTVTWSGQLSDGKTISMEVNTGG
ncbi:hypothetical protein I6E91_17055 [Enterocloster clostridioformis]|uniref:hypothetical protein n=1 Tax=Enterocloster clostridioformis TaxID=1531 RepID=UPI001F351A34|nr:hypothetical protein [Enterocloster clostridioformis]MCF2703781.1 hypothetical protein [Enterocloster clostridioformis]MCI7607699.1 hypothetical protein [Enterocloster clostridioformis]